MIILIILLAILWGYLFYYGEERRQYFASLTGTVLTLLFLVVIAYIVYRGWATSTKTAGIAYIVGWYLILLFMFVGMLTDKKQYFWRSEFWVEKRKKHEMSKERGSWEEVWGWDNLIIGIVFPWVFYLIRVLSGDLTLDQMLLIMKIAITEFLRYLTFGVL
tara:strand:+ start:540 stop:1022 length:483 start_codon:yes stop_codon:yes gene_type:complete